MELILAKGIMWQNRVISIKGKIEIRRKSLYIFLISPNETFTNFFTVLNLSQRRFYLLLNINFKRILFAFLSISHKLIFQLINWLCNSHYLVIKNNWNRIKYHTGTWWYHCTALATFYDFKPDLIIYQSDLISYVIGKELWSDH